MSIYNHIIRILHLLWNKWDAIGSFYGLVWHDLPYILTGVCVENRLYGDKGGIRKTSQESIALINARDNSACKQGRSDGDGK